MPGPLVLFAAVMSLTPGPNVVLVTATHAQMFNGSMAGLLVLSLIPVFW